PNFLIMLGDRYGWIPLQNIIEKDEFELITKDMIVEDKELILDWYYEDKNQIPVSYILKQRTDEYKVPNTWIKVESKLRDIIQNAVENLEDDIKNRYITSATQSEAIEGIISYSTKTEHQKKLLELVPELGKLDHKHIFGFFRSLDKNTVIKDKFISDDYEKAKEFKEKVKSQLIDENILSVNTSQISEDNLNESYLEKFTSSIIEFLKRQVDLQITKDEDKNYSSLEIEKQQQFNYLNQKLENFLGQEKVLNDIQNYINNEDDKPLIISGPSGIGKSSIMAKAIEDTSNTTDKKIIYRFIGATPNSTTTTDILTSILEELGITIEDEKNKYMDIISLSKEQNNFNKLSSILYNTVLEIKKDVVLFIDAVDQLSNDDQFLWLPNQLPSNTKIVISALRDKNYKEDSKYFYTLEDKISNYIDIEPFDKPIKLLQNLLKHKNRTLQGEQKEYFLTQYHIVNTPLYVYMAANEMQYWKSSDKIDDDITLSLSQKDIVKDFIENLTTIHHHNQHLVQKVFGYILASKDGLSEYEILELLNTDKELVKHLAPDTWHTNTTQELPLVIWTRFYSHIKPFLSRKNQDGQELLYFFHREFIDVIENQPNQYDEHENSIKATKQMIEINQDKEFDSNRWGKLFILLTINYHEINKYEDKTFDYYNDILVFTKSEIILKYAKYLNIILDNYLDDKNNFISKYLIDLLILITDKNKDLSYDFYIIYINTLHKKAFSLVEENNYTMAIEIEEKNIKSIKELPIFSKIKDFDNLKNIDFTNENSEDKFQWLYQYLKIKTLLSWLYWSDNKANMLNINKNDYLLYEKMHKNNPDNQIIEVIYYTQLSQYVSILQQNKNFNLAKQLLLESLDVLKIKYNNKEIYIYESYARLLHCLSVDAQSVKKYEEKEKYFLASYNIYKELLKYDFNRFSKTLISINNKLIDGFNAKNKFLESEYCYKDNIKLLNQQGKEEVENIVKKISNRLSEKIFTLKKKTKQEELFFVIKRLIEYVYYPNMSRQLFIKSNSLHNL
ncbi:MAG: ATP-binding protein, partial [Campylobacterota bacterium]|nr:ATP-binding protein [Campylobacterota bacterium]